MPAFQSTFDLAIAQVGATPKAQIAIVNGSADIVRLALGDFCCGENVPSLELRRFAGAPGLSVLAARPAIYCVDSPSTSSGSVVVATAVSDTITPPGAGLDYVGSLNKFPRSPIRQPGLVVIAAGGSAIIYTTEAVRAVTVGVHLAWTERSP